MAGDDAEARRRRAAQLRRQIDKQGDTDIPPRSPYEFIERERREHAEDDQEGGRDAAPDDAGDEDDEPPAA